MSSIGVGTWAWGNRFLWGYRPETDDDFLEKTFNEAVNRGLYFIDTADSYGTGQLNGRSEELLGKFLRKLPLAKHKKITVATKLAPYPWRIGRQGFRDAFKASKARLGGKLDRVQLHWSTSRYAPWQEVQLMDGLCDLFDRGVISQIGISNMGPNRLRWFHNRFQKRGIPLTSLQIQFSLLSLELKSYFRIFDVCKELNIQLLAYSPLALGVLSVRPSNFTIPKTTFLRSNLFYRLLPASLKVREELYKIAVKRGTSQAQVALNWCRSHGSIPIAGLRDPMQAIDAANAMKWKLTSREKNRLDIVSQHCKVRMPDNPFQSS
ncbi:aldo/keto reductase [Prochlorococcus marinus]|uniref:aldo/keto reductase n=1 Tax=Prochlorococcus marinus TaxID=1219 RepID=UPI0022B406BF|nr:aldo/keto reductase [Prochlorococcus marinus]